MTIPEACELILQAAVIGAGGEIFVLDMGQPVKISFLAEQMVRLSGKEPYRDVDIVYTGIRPGEKLFEELFHEQENLGKTVHPKILLARHRRHDPGEVLQAVNRTKTACDEFDDDGLRRVVAELVPEMALAGRGAGAKVVPLPRLKEGGVERSAPRGGDE
jgi:FlaA1/EpsC-like NDP-sugar epimerase